MTLFNKIIRLALMASLVWASLVQAQTYPTRPVTVIIPFPPGGTLDVVGRLLAQKLSEQMGQPFVVENRAGAGGIIGGNILAKAAPDGYTLMFSASTSSTTEMVIKSVPYSVIKDFAPIALVAKAPLSVAVNNQLAASDVQGLISYAKANPGKVSFAIGSSASAGHLAAELLKSMSGIEYIIVPYKGSSPAYNDLIGGRITGFIDPILGSAGFAKAGQLKVLAVTSKNRVPNLPDVPTVGESLPGYEFYSWYGLWGPANLPTDITEKLNSEVNRALASMEEKLTPQGLLVTPGSVQDFVDYQRDYMALTQKIVTEGNIRAE
jgi:tripartite-type tricarboxylate transporter receptor subunit TctC